MQKLKNISYIRAEGNEANTRTTAKESILKIQKFKNL